jgi:trimeric autotransporter adhesin
VLLCAGLALGLSLPATIRSHPPTQSDMITTQATLPATPATIASLAFDQQAPIGTLSDAAWDDRFGAPGVTCCLVSSEYIHVARTHGNDVYVGGEFTTMANLGGTNAIARWDGRRWHALGAGLRFEGFAGEVYDIAISGDDVYVVGEFDRAGDTSVRNVARWNIPTQTWHAVGSGDGPRDVTDRPTPLNAVTAIEGQVFVGGEFVTIGGVAANGVALWDGTRWSPLAGGVDNTSDSFDQAPVFALLARGDQVFVGGLFDRAVNPSGIASVNANNVAVWSRSTSRWSALGTGVSSSVRALAADGNTLYVGGYFTGAGGSPASRVARWDGTGWSALGGGVAGAVLDLTVTNGTLYVSGDFASASGVTNTSNLAAWNGSQWLSLRTDQLFNDPAEQWIDTAVALPSGVVLAGGSFNGKNQPLFRSVALWDGTRWSGTGQGLTSGWTSNGISYAVAVTPQGQAFVGGSFSEVGGLPARNLLLWDGNTWRDVGGGVGGTVNALLLRGEDLYVGGRFTTVGNGVAATGIARWNLRTQTWHAVGSGLPSGTINAMAFVGNTLFVGGTGFGSQTECCLWKFDGTTWAPFSPRYITDYFAGSTSTSVLALTTDGQRLFVGGVFLDVRARATGNIIYAGDIFAYEPATDAVRVFGSGQANDSNGVAKSGVFPYVSALAVADGALYIGGRFDKVQTVAAANIARNNGSGWLALGTGVDGEEPVVNALIGNGTELYVGGRFESAGQQTFNVARWNTRAQQWSTLGCGISGGSGVRALAVQPPGTPNPGLYTGGAFVAAGCQPASGFAIWRNFGAFNLSPRVHLPVLLR